MMRQYYIVQCIEMLLSFIFYVHYCLCPPLPPPPFSSPLFILDQIMFLRCVFALRCVCFMNCPSLYTIRAKMTVCENLVWSSFHSEQAHQLRYAAPLQALLEHGNLMNQRLYVQRPSVFTRCFAWKLESLCRGKKTSPAHIPQPLSSLKRHCSELMPNGIRDSFLRKWIFQIFYNFLLRGGGAVGRSGVCLVHSEVERSSLPAVYSLKVLLVPSELSFISGAAADILNAV